MIAELTKKEIQCPTCKTNFLRPQQTATATCTSCGASVTLIDQVMEGHLVFRGELLTRGKILIRNGGSVKGDLSATEVLIDGLVEGNVTAIEKLTLGKQAKLNGNAVAEFLVVDEGACLWGHLEIGLSRLK